MNRIIVCNTYYQLIMAIQMKGTLFKNDKVDVIISDHSKNGDFVAEQLDGLNLFSKVFFIQTKDLDQESHGIREALAEVMTSALCLKKQNRFSQVVDNCSYDELIYYNISSSSVLLFSLLQNIKADLICSRFEEGLFSYKASYHEKGNHGYTKRINTIFCARRLMKKRNLDSVIGNFYCFYPELYQGLFHGTKVPQIDDQSQTTEILRKIFCISGKEFDYHQKYIFFTSVYDFEGGAPIGEYDVVKQIADMVGMDNLLVKTHPRDIRSIYTDNGFHVDKNSSAPWEVIQLSGDFSNHIFLTAASGSVLAGSFMSETPVRTIYLYKLCNLIGNPSAQKSAKDIHDLICKPELKDVLLNVHIAETIEEVYE